MTFAKQWSDAQLYDLAEQCVVKLRARGEKAGWVHATVRLLLGEYLGKTLKVLGSVGAHHGTPNCYFIWGCRCDPCSIEGEREEARLMRQGRKAS